MTYTPEALAKLEEAIVTDEKRIAGIADKTATESKVRLYNKLVDKKLDEAITLEAAGR